MKLMTRTGVGYFATLAAGIAIGLAVVGTATAASAAPAGQATIRLATHHFSLAASAFAPDGLHDTTSDYFNNWDPSTLNNQDSGRCFNAGLALPAGSTLKSVTLYYTADSSTMYFEINRQDLLNHTSVDLASTDTPETETSTYTSVTLPIPTAYAALNMTGYAYSAGVCPSGTTTFTGLSITYTEPVS
jgi:hypothetical protein